MQGATGLPLTLTHSLMEGWGKVLGRRGQFCSTQNAAKGPAEAVVSVYLLLLSFLMNNMITYQ